MTGLAPIPAAIAHRSFGALLREWRSARGTSQLALSTLARVSTRHLSYLETGRASPSREMVLMLARAFEMPLRDRNTFLQAAGFAPMYRETPLQAHPMGPVRDAIDVLLRSTEPNPAFVLNRRADILAANETGQWLLTTFNEDIDSFARPYNIARLLVSPKGDRAYIENWEEIARLSLARVRHELGGARVRDSTDEELLKTIEAALAELGDQPLVSESLPLLITVRFRRGPLALNLFSIHATLGTQLDVTLQELRIEMFFPADEHSKRVLERRQAHTPTSADDASGLVATPPQRGGDNADSTSNVASAAAANGLGATATRRGPRTRRPQRRPGRAPVAGGHGRRR
jgi:DNA-binding XRE family transcriptional regulator